MDSDLTDIYGFTGFPKYLDDDVFADKIDDMLVADIDMDMFDKIDNFSDAKLPSSPPPTPPQSIASPLINPDDFLNDLDGDDEQTTCSDRSSPSLSNSPSSSTSSTSCDNMKNDSSSDESINAECSQQFQGYASPTILSSAQMFQPQNTPIRILQGTLIPVSTIKIEATPATVGTAQPIILTAGSQCIRYKRNKIVLPKASADSDGKKTNSSSQKIVYDPINEQALKKQQRMIKNRESASLSRNKKREYVMSLETQVKSLLVENNILKNENKNLKAQISNMLATCQCRVAQYSYFTKQISPQTRKNAAILLAMIFMVSMSFGNINTLLSRHSGSEDSILTQQANDHVGRHLLWVDENATSLQDSSLRNITKPIKCLSAFNQTENRRIETDLRNWIGINDDSNATHNENNVFSFIPGFHNMFKPSFKSLYKTQRSAFKRKNPHYNPDWLEERRRRYSGQQTARTQKSKNPMQLFYPARKGRFSKLFEGIGRRDDTFYVLSFSNDHLLLSAANHSKSARPRMSFVLPVDDSFQEDKVMLMQIDCEVMNTSVIELKKEFIPEHLRTPSVNKGESNKVQRNNTRSFDVPNKHDILTIADRLHRESREKHEFNKMYKPYFVEKSNFGKEPNSDFNDLYLP